MCLSQSRIYARALAPRCDFCGRGRSQGKLPAWRWSYRCTAANVKEKGNVLEARVTNLWPNRLIYDAGLPEAERLTRTNINPYKPTDPLLPSGLLGPVRISAVSALR